MLSPEKIQEFLNKGINSTPNFSVACGISVTHVDAEKAEGVLNVTEHSLNPARVVHGGALMALADTVSGSLVYACQGMCVTTNATIEFLKAATGDKIRCVATPIKMGHSLCVVRSNLFDNKDGLVATTTMTFFIMQS